MRVSFTVRVSVRVIQPRFSNTSGYSILQLATQTRRIIIYPMQPLGPYRSVIFCCKYKFAFSKHFATSAKCTNLHK